MLIPKKNLLVAVVALALGSPAYANLLTNPGFEDPIGSEWTSTIVSGTAWSLGASTARVHSGTYSYGMAYGPTGPTGEAYIEQLLTGLTPGETYQVSGWVNMDWRASKAWAYIEAQGGETTVQAPDQGANVDDAWRQYLVTQTADSGGNLTVRLDLTKYGTTTGDKTAIAYFDDIVVQVPEPATLVLGLLGGLGLLVVLQRRRRAA